jgi:hypothetical protein
MHSAASHRICLTPDFANELIDKIVRLIGLVLVPTLLLHSITDSLSLGRILLVSLSNTLKPRLFADFVVWRKQLDCCSHRFADFCRRPNVTQSRTVIKIYERLFKGVC